MCRDESVITSRWSTGQTLCAVTRVWSQVVDLLVRLYVPWRESDHKSLIYWSDFICTSRWSVRLYMPWRESDHKSLIYWSDFICRDERVITSRWSTGQTLYAVTREWSQVVDLLVRLYMPWRQSDHKSGVSGGFSPLSLSLVPSDRDVRQAAECHHVRALVAMLV